MNVRDLTDGTRGPDEEAAIHIGNLLPYWAAVPLFLLVTVPLLWRRVAPLAAAGAALAGLVVNLALVGSEYVRCGVLLPTAFLLAYATGARLDRRGALLGLLITGSLTVLDLVDRVRRRHGRRVRGRDRGDVGRRPGRARARARGGRAARADRRAARARATSAPGSRSPPTARG